MLFWAWVQKTVHGVETHWLSGKEKVASEVVSKESDTDSVLGHERTIIIDFLDKVATVNSASYC